MFTWQWVNLNPLIHSASINRLLIEMSVAMLTSPTPKPSPAPPVAQPTPILTPQPSPAPPVTQPTPILTPQPSPTPPVAQSIPSPKPNPPPTPTASKTTNAPPSPYKQKTHLYNQVKTTQKLSTTSVGGSAGRANVGNRRRTTANEVPHQATMTSSRDMRRLRGFETNGRF